MATTNKQRGRFILVTGGRDYENAMVVDAVLKQYQDEIWLVMQGGAPGLDTLVENWCRKNEVPCLRVPAEWKKYNKKAGHMRNSQMLTFLGFMPDLLLSFPGGMGTADMTRKAKLAGISIRRIKQ